jgi:hypothetical protein
MDHAMSVPNHSSTGPISFAGSALFFRFHMHIDISPDLLDDADTIVLFSFESWVCKAISTVLAFGAGSYRYCLNHPGLCMPQDLKLYPPFPVENVHGAMVAPAHHRFEVLTERYLF